MKLFFTLSCILLLLSACNPICSDEELRIINAIDNGEPELVIEYLKNGGDPMLECTATSGGRLGSDKSLPAHIFNSRNHKLISVWLKCDPDKIYLEKRLGLYLFSVQTNEEIVQILINRGVVLRPFLSSCVYTMQPIQKLELLLELDYQINSRGVNGNTIIHNLASCNENNNISNTIMAIKFLKTKGVDLTVVNNDGLTPYELAVDPELKKILKPE